MTTRVTAAAVTAIILAGPALGDAESDKVRAKLLASPTWTYEWASASGKVNSGVVRFALKDGKLIGSIDIGWKCDNEVTLQADGFAMMTCHDVDLRWVQAGDEFTATYGGYKYWIRLAR